MSTDHSRLSQIVIAIASSTLVLGAFAQDYTIQGIGALPDLDPTIPTPPGSSGNGINDLGVVVGASVISGGSLQIDENTVIAEPGIPHPIRAIDGEIEDLGIPFGDVPIDVFPKPTSIAWDINNAGWIVGEYVPVSDLLFHAFVWLPEASSGLSAGYTELPWLSDRGRAWSINENGVIAGESRAPGELGIRAVFWALEDGHYVVHDLGTFGGASSAAYGVNELGQITGYNMDADSTVTTFLYLPEPAYGFPAGMNDVTPGLLEDRGNAINDLGQIVGKGDVWLPMIWLPEPAYGLPAGPTVFSAAEIVDEEDLALIGAIAIGPSEFTAINNNGDAVGWGDFAVQLPNGGVGFSRHGIAWIDGEFSLVQQLAPPQWTRFSSTWDINDEGQITGVGQNPDGDFVGYVMSPACAGDATGDGQVDVSDLVQVITNWGACPPGCAADFNGDGQVDVTDLVTLVMNWGACV